MESLESSGAPAGEAGAPAFAPPRIVLSRCLELEPVRYNGSRIPFDLVRHLSPWVEWVPVCPEVAIGLGVPRDPVRLVRGSDGVRLRQPATERDLTSEMADFAEEFLADLGAVDGFILKNRSPSCGPADVKVYASEEGAPVDRSSGAFAGVVASRLPEVAVEDEGRLRNFRIREHFLTRIFASARLRAVADSSEPRRLTDFQARYKLLLMAYDQDVMRELGRTAAEAGSRPFGEVVETYQEGLARALEEPPPYTAVVNVLHHGMGHVKDELSSGEKAHFLDTVERYRKGRIPLAGVTELLRAWSVRFGNEYLGKQAFLLPYPEQLVSLSDSGKGGAAR